MRSALLILALTACAPSIAQPPHRFDGARGTVWAASPRMAQTGHVQVEEDLTRIESWLSTNGVAVEVWITEGPLRSSVGEVPGCYSEGIVVVTEAFLERPANLTHELVHRALDVAGLSENLPPVLEEGLAEHFAARASVGHRVESARRRIANHSFLLSDLFGTESDWNRSGTDPQLRYGFALVLVDELGPDELIERAREGYVSQAVVEEMLGGATRFLVEHDDG